ncbi:MAG: ABC transporter substrate binding protein [Planctomycetaceae bacterium]
MNRRTSLFVAVALVLVIILAAVWRVQPRAQPTSTTEIHVLIFGSNPLLLSVTHGLQNRFEELDQAKRYKFVIHDAGFQTINASSQARIAFSQKPAAVIALGTPSIKAALPLRPKGTPFFFGATNDPEGLGLNVVASEDGKKSYTGSENISGLVSEFNFEIMAELAILFGLANGKASSITVGYPLNDHERNSVIAGDAIEAALRKKGHNFFRAPVGETSQTGTATRTLISKGSDVIQLGPDNTVTGGIGGILSAVNPMRTPVLASERESVAKGAACGVGIDFKQLGNSLADKVFASVVTEKHDPVSIAGFDAMCLYVNEHIAKELLSGTSQRDLLQAFAERHKIALEAVKAK